MILDDIRTAYMNSRKRKDRLEMNVYGSLIGDIETQAKNTGKEPTDDDVMKIIQKYIKNSTITRDLQAKHGLDFSESQKEINLLQRYLPQQMATDLLESTIQTYINSGSSTLGHVMGALKRDHNGKYDPMMARKIIERLLSNE